ncbi:hypothetical protein [Sphingomonas guangdongensis]|uniref:hypothetical protein n=1 Tax=Sphingomonas guangdongensis TaxID=1141890 RepID=UPI00118188DA|nr:hypothetical protein [Sphingomonas guangdongensis]
MTAIFLPSALIALLGFAPAALSNGNLLARVWQVADDVGPAVKLMMGALLLGGFLILVRWGQPVRRMRHVVSAAIGITAVAATVTVIPAGLSRGFGIALTGVRFEPTLTALYLLAGAIAGLTFAITLDRCAASTFRSA